MFRSAAAPSRMRLVPIVTALAVFLLACGPSAAPSPTAKPAEPAKPAGSGRRAGLASGGSGVTSSGTPPRHRPHPRPPRLLLLHRRPRPRPPRRRQPRRPLPGCCQAVRAGPGLDQVGAVVPITGRYAAGGEQIKNGYELAVEDINTAAA